PSSGSRIVTIGQLPSLRSTLTNPAFSRARNPRYPEWRGIWKWVNLSAIVLVFLQPLRYWSINAMQIAVLLNKNVFTNHPSHITGPIKKVPFLTLLVLCEKGVLLFFFAESYISGGRLKSPTVNSLLIQFSNPFLDIDNH